MNATPLAPRSDRDFYGIAWAAALAGPVAWAADLEAVYALAPLACRMGLGPLHAVSILGLLVAGLGTLLAWVNATSFGRAHDASREESPAAQIGFLSRIGLMSNPLFALIIAGQWLAVCLLDPCSPP